MSARSPRNGSRRASIGSSPRAGSPRSTFGEGHDAFSSATMVAGQNMISQQRRMSDHRQHQRRASYGRTMGSNWTPGWQNDANKSPSPVHNRRNSADESSLSRQARWALTQGDFRTIYTDAHDAIDSKDHFRSVAREQYDQDRSTVTSKRFERARPVTRLNRQNKDRTTYDLGNDPADYKSSTHKAMEDAHNARANEPPSSRPWALDDKKTYESYNIITGADQDAARVEQSYRFGGPRVSNNKALPSVTRREEYNPVKNVMEQRRQAPAAVDVSGTPPLGSAAAIRPSTPTGTQYY